MTLSSRSITRAGALTLAALTFAACSDSTAPLDVSPEQLEAIGQTMAVEIESGVLQLTAQDAMGTVDAPAFSVQHRPANLGGAAFNLQRAAGYPVSLQVVDPQCGVPSQDPPTDSDVDQVPDNLTITFALPACHFSDASGSFDLTGVIRVTDPMPGTAAMAFNMAVDNFRITFSGTDLSGFVRRDGLTSVVATQTGLSQTVSWLESAQITGFPSLGVDIDWSATFAAAQGGTITHGEPLPDGVYHPNGSFDFRQGDRSAHFTVTTVEPLQYSATCAAGVVAGTTLAPFMAGKVRVAVSNDGNLGYAEVTYVDCNEASVLYVSR
jgi:hypothetical protein